MSKKLLLILFSLVGLAALGYYAYTRWAESREKVDLWTLVPDDAVFVVESNNHTAFVTHLKSTEI
ncbi:MAG: hypothetical protein LPK19_15730, partial [Hymenobacteraceae bacterium]|nr:hypothetical protein [Hymenobacteraceae bacterium]MDX5397687.1 hypothetical protein [Hymenobacteraceae bacterium]MDX5513765.1 hypothetical protein [Hymenobacteraceae bacterium]